MKTAKIRPESRSPITFGRAHNTSKIDNDREQPHPYEIRTWREKAHADKDGRVYLTPMMLKNCLADAPKFMGDKIPGRGKETYTKHFEAGILITDPIYLGVTKEELQPLWLFVPSDGKRGGAKRVMKCFPIIHEWEGTATIYILDEIISLEVLQRFLTAAGQFIGMGSLRVRNNGLHGRFDADVLSFE
jgi:hypothetical protein